MTTEWSPTPKMNWLERALEWTDSRIRPDPYLYWADATGFSELMTGSDRGKRLTILMELNEGLTATGLAEKLASRGTGIRVPTAYLRPPAGLEKSRFCTATIGRDVFKKELIDRSGMLKDWVARFEVGLSLLEPGEPALQPLDTIGPHGVGGPLVIGVIDDGLAFAHERFRTADRRSTRIEYLWNQNEPVEPDLRPPHPTPADFGYGTELTKKDIERYLAGARSGTASAADEDEIYRLARHPGVDRRYSHGTHVMDLACGLAPEDIKQGAPRIVCVQPQLPSGKTRDTSGRWLGVHMLDGLRYILDRADCIARAESRRKCGPVIVNMSFGNIAGPHDGSALLEAAIDELIDLRTAFDPNSRLSVVIPTGNHHLARCHASFALAKDSMQSLHWRIVPDDATPSFLEIWLSPSSPEPDVEIRVTPPWGESSGWIGKKQVWTCRKDGEFACTVVYLERVATGEGRMILVGVAPTTTFAEGRTMPPPGTWTIAVRNRRSEAVRIDGWIQRDETAYGYARRGRQSRFDDPNYRRFDEIGKLEEEDDHAPYELTRAGDGKPYVKRANTMNAIATGHRTLVVGGYRESDGDPVPYSASGPTRKPRTRSGPDGLAVTERSRTLFGVQAAGTRSGSVVAANGTSVAAPQAASLRAKTVTTVAGNRNEPPDERRDFRKEAARHESARGGRSPRKERGGAGRINPPGVPPPGVVPGARSPNDGNG